MNLSANLKNIPTISLNKQGGVLRFCNRGDLLVNNESMRHALVVIPEDAVPVDIVYQDGSLAWMVFYEGDKERYVYPWEEECMPHVLMNVPRYVKDYDGVMHGCVSLAKGWQRDHGLPVKIFTFLFDVSPELPAVCFNSLYGQYEWLQRRQVTVDFKKTKPPARHELKVYDAFGTKDVKLTDTNAYSFYNRLNRAVNLMDTDVMALVNHPTTHSVLVLPNSNARITKGIEDSPVTSSCVIVTK